MQAIILAAGLGRRLGEVTQNLAKCMIEVSGKTLMARALKQLDARHFSRIVIVIGWQGEVLKRHILTCNIQTPIIFVENPIFDKTNNIYSLSLVQDYLKEEDTLLLESDLIFDDSALDKILNDKNENAALVSPYTAGMDGTVVVLNNNGMITHFIQKNDFDFERSHLYYKTVNIYKFEKNFINQYYIPFLNAYTAACGTNEYYEQVLSILTRLDKINIAGVVLRKEKWFEIDDIFDLHYANIVFAKPDEKLKATNARYGGFWRNAELLDFMYLTNPFYPTKRIEEELKANTELILKAYPSGQKMTSLLAGKHFGVSAENILLANGAAEIILALSIYLKGKKIALCLPSFEEYINRFISNGFEPIIFTPKNNDFSYNTEDLIAFLKENKPEVFLLVNPDNPSGNIIPKNDLIKLSKFCEENKILLIIDESFVDFYDINESLITPSFLRTHQSVLVVKSISKSYGVAGLRLGVLASGDAKAVADIAELLPIWNINGFAEFFMQIASHFEADYKAALELFKIERAWFFAALQSLPFLRVIPSAANYFLCEVLPPFSSAQITERLFSQHKILIKDCSAKKSFNNGNFIRFAIKDRNANQALLNALKEEVQMSGRIYQNPTSISADSVKEFYENRAQHVKGWNAVLLKDDHQSQADMSSRNAHELSLLQKYITPPPLRSAEKTAGFGCGLRQRTVVGKFDCCRRAA